MAHVIPEDGSMLPLMEKGFVIKQYKVPREYVIKGTKQVAFLKNQSVLVGARPCVKK